jgi:hypothetical protein
VRAGNNNRKNDLDPIGYRLLGMIVAAVFAVAAIVVASIIAVRAGFFLRDLAIITVGLARLLFSVGGLIFVIALAGAYTGYVLRRNRKTRREETIWDEKRKTARKLIAERNEAARISREKYVPLPEPVEREDAKSMKSKCWRWGSMTGSMPGALGESMNERQY